nr:calmodulin-lysine N-methyltransferase [Leptinotarsa decemlineata]
MDQSKDIFGLDSKYNIDFQEVLRFGNEKKKVARRRWAILAKALKSPSESQPSSPTDEFSVRRISSFMLLKTQELHVVPIMSPENQYCDQFKKRTWYKYSTRVNGTDYFINVGHRNRTFSAEDLMGFNNTGNVCIWPSEETLSYFVCSNLGHFLNKSVIELGGGMSCLAGLFVAKYGNATSVTVTDGNKLSVDNVQTTIKCNEFDIEVKCHVFKWSSFEPSYQYDVILCADCLFFDDARADLIECLWNCLANDGIAYIMAPERGDTLDKFILQSESRGFSCKKIVNYSTVVWEKRLALLDNCDYNDNIHYPVLIEVTKF